jgi:serine/threonine protein kinase
MPLLAGTRLGPYEIVAPIGAGGMGEVYRARDPRLGRDVAIKVLPESLATDSTRLHRFEQEARAVAALSHPNVVAIHDIGTAERPYIVTELLEGETLRARLDRGPLSSRPTIDLARQLVAGLAAAHARGIVHRDLNPQNVFVTHDGVLKILDFGLAKSVGPDAGLPIARSSDDAPGRPDLIPTMTSAGTILGTVGYMAPEQVRGERVDSRADLFAVGAILYEMATGGSAFKGDSPADTMSAVLREQPADLAMRSGTPPALARIVRRCLEKNVRDRFQSARDLAFALDSMSDGEHGVPAVTKTEQKSVAVLPLVNMSADADNQYFSDGLAEELINALTRLPGLHVASRTSSFRFRGRDADIQQIGRDLRVATVLEGSVRRAGDRLRVTAQLTDVANGYHIWSERYDRQMADVFDIQDEIVESIVKALAPALIGDARRIGRRPTENLQAFELYLKGRHYWHQRSPNMLQVARRHFEEVIAIDPRYALAYAGIADCFSVSRFYGWLSAGDAREPARAAVERSMELDPSLAEVHCSKGMYYFYLEPTWRSAMPHLRRAVAINPSFADARGYIALCLACEGRIDDAIVELDLMMKLGPLSPVGHVFATNCYTMAGRYEEAERAARCILDLQSDSLMGLYAVSNAFVRRHLDEAIAAAERCVALSRAPFCVGQLGLVYGLAGRSDEARKLLVELDERQTRGEYVPAVARLQISVGLRDLTRIKNALAACIADETPVLDICAIAGALVLEIDDPDVRRLIDRIVNPPHSSGPSQHATLG